MANTPQARRAAESSLLNHISIVGGSENDRETQIVDLIADLLLLLPDDERAELVAERAQLHASQDRSESV